VRHTKVFRVRSWTWSAPGHQFATVNCTEGRECDREWQDVWFRYLVPSTSIVGTINKYICCWFHWMILCNHCHLTSFRIFFLSSKWNDVCCNYFSNQNENDVISLCMCIFFTGSRAFIWALRFIDLGTIGGMGLGCNWAERVKKDSFCWFA